MDIEAPIPREFGSYNEPLLIVGDPVIMDKTKLNTIIDSNNVTGTNGQFLSKSESGLQWVTGDGTPGSSAYEIAVDNGFVGTEEEWLDSLKGEKGDPGELDLSEYNKGPTSLTGSTNSSLSKLLTAYTDTDSNEVKLRETGISIFHNSQNDRIHFNHDETRFNKRQWNIIIAQESGELLDRFSITSSGYRHLSIPVHLGNQLRFENGIGTKYFGNKYDSFTNDGWEIELTGTTQPTLNQVLAITDTDKASWIDISGVKGDSAYEVAVQNGFIGTEQDWLDSLKGEKGDDGPVTTFAFFKKRCNHTIEGTTVTNDFNLSLKPYLWDHPTGDYYDNGSYLIGTGAQEITFYYDGYFLVTVDGSITFEEPLTMPANCQIFFDGWIVGPYGTNFYLPFIKDNSTSNKYVISGSQVYRNSAMSSEFTPFLKGVNFGTGINYEIACNLTIAVTRIA